MTAPNEPINIKMKADKKSPERYFVCALGFNTRTQAILQMVLDRYGENRFEFAALDESEILLVNGDTPDIVDSVYKARATRFLPAIVLSTLPREDIPEAICLLNPMPPRLLIETLLQVIEKLHPHKVKPALSAALSVSEKKADPVSDKNRKGFGTAPVAKPTAPSSAVSQSSDVSKPPPLAPELPAKSQRFSFSAAEIEQARAEWQREKEILKAKKLGQAAGVLEHDMNSPDNRGGFLRDIDLADPEQLQSIYFQPEGFLSELLRKMVQAAGDSPPLLEVVISGKRLLFDFTFNRWGGDYDEHSLRAMCLGSLPATLEVRWVPREEMVNSKVNQQGELEMVAAQTDLSKMQLIPNRRTQRAEFILAQIGLWCAHGRLPEGTDVNAPLSLRHWPNMPHLPRTPGSMRIAALWMQRPCSLVETVSLTGLMQRQVFAFYIICHTLCLFNESRRHAHASSLLKARPEPVAAGPVSAEPAEKKSAAPKGFLRRLMDRVWSGSEDE